MQAYEDQLGGVQAAEAPAAPAPVPPPVPSAPAPPVPHPAFPPPAPLLEPWIQVATLEFDVTGLAFAADAGAAPSVSLASQRLSGAILTVVALGGTYSGPAAAAGSVYTPKLWNALAELCHAGAASLWPLQANGPRVRVALALSTGFAVPPGLPWAHSSIRAANALVRARREVVAWVCTAAPGDVAPPMTVSQLSAVTPSRSLSPTIASRMDVHFRSSLRPYQAAAVEWMGQREAVGDGAVSSHLHPLWLPLPNPSSATLYMCPYTGEWALHPVPCPPDFSGGILADEVRFVRVCDCPAVV